MGTAQVLRSRQDTVPPELRKIVSSWQWHIRQRKNLIPVSHGSIWPCICPVQLQTGSNQQIWFGGSKPRAYWPLKAARRLGGEIWYGRARGWCRVANGRMWWALS